MFKKLSDKIKVRLFNLDLDDYRSLDEKKKNILLKIFFYLMGIMILLFISFNIAKKNYLPVIIDLAVFILFSAFYFIFKTKNKLQINSYFFVFIFCMIVLFYVLTGGVENTGLFFIVLLPIPTILLTGRKKGILILAILLAISIISQQIKNIFPWIASYSFDYSLRVYICFITITFLAYLNELVFEILYIKLKKTADSLLESREKFKSLSLNREKFLSIISHDLKNQLSGFSSVTDLLKSNYSKMKPAEQIEQINLLWENSRSNIRLLQDLLKWSELKNESFPYNPQNVKIETIFRNIIELFDLDIEKKNISVFLKVKSNSEVYADYDMLSAIVRNLVSNSIKHVDINGKISIKAEEKDDNFMIIEIDDDGAGIEDQRLKNLQQSLTSKTIGSVYGSGGGVGLLIAKEFVEQCNGEMTIESQLNIGTQVSFTIPLAE